MNSVSLAPNSVASFPLSAGMGITAANGKPSLESAAKGLEGTFLAILLKEMRQGLEGDSFFGHDSGDVLGGLFDQFMAQHLTQSGGLGLANSLMQQLESIHSHDDPTQQPERT